MFSNCTNCLLSISLFNYLHIADHLNCTYGCSSARQLDLVPTLHYQIESLNMCSLLKISHANVVNVVANCGDVVNVVIANNFVDNLIL